MVEEPANGGLVALHGAAEHREHQWSEVERQLKLGDALEATSAFPGVFQPKSIDGARYVDGAVASSTHADTLVGEQLDVALISGPPSRSGVGRSGLVPDDRVLAAAEGFPRTRPEAASDVVEAARKQTIAAFGSVPKA